MTWKVDLLSFYIIWQVIKSDFKMADLSIFCLVMCLVASMKLAFRTHVTMSISEFGDVSSLIDEISLWDSRYQIQTIT